MSKVNYILIQGGHMAWQGARCAAPNIVILFSMLFRFNDLKMSKTGVRFPATPQTYKVMTMTPEELNDKRLLDYYREQEEQEAAYDREFAAECEKWVMDAIDTEVRVIDPQTYATINYTLYKVAMEAVQSALYHERTYNQRRA